MECYFDHVATNPLGDGIFDVMAPFYRKEYGNPLSIYPLGANARTAIESAREDVAALINAKPSEIIFTSNGAEANNFAIRGTAFARQHEGKHIIISRMEHHSILNSARFLEKLGFTVTYVSPDKYGLIDPESVRKAIMDETIIISIIHASPEVGTLEPVKEIASFAREKNITFHTDGVASVGNIPVDVKDLGVDLLSLAGHQFYGPKGAGALYMKEGQRIIPLIFGGIQEGGRRAGTENVPAIAGMGKAAEIAASKLTERVEHVKVLRDKLIEGIMKIDKTILTGHPEKRLPGHASFCVEYIEGEGMLLMLAAKGIYVASGSACTSKALKASPVLLSMGIPTHVAHGSVVFTLGAENTMEQVEYTLEEFPQIINRLRELSPFAGGWEDMEEGGSCTPKK